MTYGHDEEGFTTTDGYRDQRDYRDPSDWEMEQGYREELARLHANDAQMPGEALWADDQEIEYFARMELALASGEVTPEFPLPTFDAFSLSLWGELPF